MRASDATILDPTTRKIKQLLVLGYNKVKITEALSYLGDFPWSTNHTEQLHGQTVVIHKAHRRYGNDRLMLRVLLKISSPLFPI